MSKAKHDGGLTNHEREILECLSETGGFLTRRVAQNVRFFGINKHQHSGAVRAWLMNLKKRGLVDYLDDQKPVCWKRTQAGSKALAEMEAAYDR